MVGSFAMWCVALLLALINCAQANDCLTKERITAECDVTEGFVRVNEKLINLTLSVDNSVTGEFSITIGVETIYLNALESITVHGFTDTFKSPVLMYITENSLKVSDSEVTMQKAATIKFDEVGGDYYVPVKLQSTQKTSGIVITLANGEFIQEMPTASWLSTWLLIVICVAGGLLIAVLGALVLKLFFKKQWKAVKSCLGMGKPKQPVVAPTPQPLPSYADEDYKRHVEHRKGVTPNEQDGYQPYPDCHFCSTENVHFNWNENYQISFMGQPDKRIRNRDNIVRTPMSNREPAK